ncbi:putative hemin transport protein [Tamilnaduibacter salinus]|uniref:Putative hemin transport protein n=1 Tax=Tamilnaduibacter salinus TaxID=1484056 RepID=A0A2U1CZJ3_9GAMM|nr:ChuX/HutX family heme-like substrate-binding protein [Tamilnaduibacter salinus]PVY78121.1 putative hemin transport protein [Tamilnaduibacter salinus]
MSEAMQQVPPKGGTDLLQDWSRLLESQPRLRIREAARQLGVSELALVRARPVEPAQPLRPDFPALMAEMHTVGEVMILARNDAVVHEVTGTFGEFRTSGSGAMGLAVGEIDVRVFFRHWQFGYRVIEHVRSGRRESLQFFDAYGVAIQKIYRTGRTNGDAWDSLVGRFTAPETSPTPIATAPERLKRADAGVVDAESLRTEWRTLKDVHHFNAMLKRHDCDRLTALELMGDEHALRLDHSAEGESPLTQLLHQVCEAACPIMTFVGNRGIVQIHTGPVEHVVPMGDWINILDPGFNLHVDLSGITQWWRVRRPTSDGAVSSLEAYDADGVLVLTVFGARKPGQPEDPLWQQQLSALEDSPCV